MRVCASDPYLDAATVAQLESGGLDFDLLPLERLLSTADIVTLHLPLDGSTHHMIDSSKLAQMKPGARFVNCARGGLVDEVALLEALESGHLAGAACDVFENEPDPLPELVQHPGFSGTPHLGGATQEAHRRVDEEIARQAGENAPAV